VARWRLAVTGQPVLDEAALVRLRRIGGPDLVRRLIELYLSNVDDRVGMLTRGVAEGDASQVELAAHTMKSSAGNVGAMRLQQTAEALEASAGSGAIDEKLVARLVHEYEESAAALRQALGEQVS
jgi:HPt (histidine-containing phosphotransfer) domain-containing protein